MGGREGAVVFGRARTDARFDRFTPEGRLFLSVFSVLIGSFRKLGVPYFGALTTRILLFRVLY